MSPLGDDSSREGGEEYRDGTGAQTEAEKAIPGIWVVDAELHVNWGRSYARVPRAWLDQGREPS